MAADYEKVKTDLTTNDIDISSRNAAVRSIEGLKGNKTEAERAEEPTKEQVIDKALEELRKNTRLSENQATKQAAEMQTAKRAEYEYDSIMRQRKNALDQANRTVTAIGMGLKSPDGKTRPRTMEEFEAQGGRKEGMAALAQLPLKQQRSFKDKIMSGDFFDSPDIKLKHEIWQLMAEDHTDPESQKRVLEHDFFKRSGHLIASLICLSGNRSLQGEYKTQCLKRL